MQSDGQISSSSVHLLNQIYDKQDKNCSENTGAYGGRVRT